jgi:prophage tail gpP-like protein
MKPVVITIGGSELTTWTEMTLKRSKEEMTGSLSVTIFAGAIPSGPMVRAAVAGAEVLVYIAGQLAFTGTVDKRKGTGSKKGRAGTKEKDTGKAGTSMSTNIGPDEYTIKLTARGKTKRLIDSSHQHPTTNMLKPTTKEVCEKLIEPFKVQLDWKGETIKLDKMRFRDGSRVVDELNRVAVENCYFMYETREGKLCVTDGCAGQSGDPLILGINILEFSAEQSEEEQKSKVKVKGQRSKKKIWGEKAVLKTHKEMENKKMKSFVPHIVQHNGDADEKTLERRARFEMNARAAKGKKIEIEVFHVQSEGGPWDIGNMHYVEVPPEGIFDVFECTELTYTVNHDKTIKTSLTLSPPPSGGADGAAGGFGLSNINFNTGSARRSQSGISMTEGQFPDAWSPLDLSVMPFMSASESLEQMAKNEPENQPASPPLTLPPWFGEIA